VCGATLHSGIDPTCSERCKPYNCQHNWANVALTGLGNYYVSLGQMADDKGPNTNVKAVKEQ